MKKFIKAFCIGVVALLTCFTITACGGKKNKTKENTTTENTTTEEKKTTADVVTYSIVKQGEIDGVNVKVTYAYTNNGVTKNKDVDFTKKYDKNTKIKVEVENNSTKRVKISALLGATSAGSVFINANSSDVLEEIILTNNLIIKLEDATTNITASLSLTQDNSADTSTETNIVHLFKTSDSSKTDLVNTSSLTLDEEVTVYVWNAASAVHLKVVNGSTTVVDKDYEKLTDQQADPLTGEGHGAKEKYTFNVKGDVIVTMTVLNEPVTREVYIPDYTYVTFSFYYNDKNGQRVDCNETANVPNGTTIYASATSVSDEEVMAYMTTGKDIIEKIKISEGDVTPQTVNFSPITVYSDIEFDYEDYDTYTLEFSSEVDGAEFEIYNVSGSEPELITTSGESYDILTEFEFKLTNDSGDKVIVNVYVGSDLYGSLVIEDEEYTFPEIVVMYDDIKVEIVEYEEFEVTIANITNTDITASFATVDLTKDTLIPTPITSGDVYPLNTPIVGMVTNGTIKEITLTIVDVDDDTIILLEETISGYDTYIFMEYPVFLSCDVIIKIVISDVDTTYKVTIQNDYDSDITINACYSIGDDDGVFDSEDDIIVGATITIDAFNNSTNEYYKILLLDGNEIIKTETIDAREGSYTGYGYMSFTLTKNLTIMILLEDPTVKYSITVDNEFTDLAINLYYENEDGDDEFITDFTSTYQSGLFINISACNEYDNRNFEITVTINGSDDVITINSGTGIDTSVILTGDMTITVEEIEDLLGWRIGLYNEYYDDTDLELYIRYSAGGDVDLGEYVTDGSVIDIEIINGTDDDVFLVVYIGNEFHEKIKVVGKSAPSGLYDIEVSEDIRIVIEEAVTYQVTYSISSDLDLDLNEIELIVFDASMGTSFLLEDGEYYDKYTPIGFYLKSDCNVIVTITNGSYKFDGELDSFCAIVYQDESCTYNGTDILLNWGFDLCVVIESYVTIDYDIQDDIDATFELGYTTLFDDDYWDITPTDNEVPYWSTIDGFIFNNEDYDIFVAIYIDDPDHEEEPYKILEIGANSYIYLSEELGCIFAPDAYSSVTFIVADTLIA